MFLGTNIINFIMVEVVAGQKHCGIFRVGENVKSLVKQYATFIVCMYIYIYIWPISKFVKATFF